MLSEIHESDFGFTFWKLVGKYDECRRDGLAFEGFEPRRFDDPKTP
jgi:hypothetical protein